MIWSNYIHPKKPRGRPKKEENDKKVHVMLNLDVSSREILDRQKNMSEFARKAIPALAHSKNTVVLGYDDCNNLIVNYVTLVPTGATVMLQENGYT